MKNVAQILVNFQVWINKVNNITKRYVTFILEKQTYQKLSKHVISTLSRNYQKGSLLFSTVSDKVLIMLGTVHKLRDQT